MLRCALVLIIVAVGFGEFVSSADPSGYALWTAFYYALDGPSWRPQQSNWLNTSVSWCQWEGIECYFNDEPNAVFLSDIGMRGSLSALPNLSPLLSKVTSLDFSFNNLVGEIPDWMGNLSKLQSLNLASNSLSGSIPDSLSNVTALSFLGLDSNQLTGSIPSWLSNLRSLMTLQLSNNHLSGTIPPSLGLLTQLQYLSLNSNDLEGPFPAELGNLYQVSIFSVSHNRLSGVLPASVASIGSAAGAEVDFSWNQFSSANLTYAPWLTCNLAHNSFPCPQPAWMVADCNVGQCVTVAVKPLLIFVGVGAGGLVLGGLIAWRFRFGIRSRRAGYEPIR